MILWKITTWEWRIFGKKEFGVPTKKNTTIYVLTSHLKMILLKNTFGLSFPGRKKKKENVKEIKYNKK